MTDGHTRQRPVDTVFLDRDGTINRKAPEGEYVISPAGFAFLPGAKEGIRLLRVHGLRVVVVTNQRGVALGRMTESDLEAIHARMLDELDAVGAHVDAVYHCPHDRDVCACRKPGVDLFLQAARDHPGLVLADSVVIGDAAADMEAAAVLRARRVLVARERGFAEVTVPVDYRAASLLDAAEWVVARR